MVNGTKQIRNCILAMLSLTSVWASDLKTYSDVYRKNSEEIRQGYQPKFDELQQKYMKSLEALKALAQGQGDLVKTKAAIAEIDRFQKAKCLPATLDAAEIPEIQAFQSAYVKQFSAWELEMTSKLGSLTAKYEQALAPLQVELVKAGKLDEATAVQEERAKAQAAVNDFTEQVTALKGQSAETGPAGADTSRTPATVAGKADAPKPSWGNAGKPTKPKIKLMEKSSMPLHATGTQYNGFPLQEDDDPTGPFNGKPVYFDQRSGCRDVVYSVQSLGAVNTLHWKGTAMVNMTIEVTDAKGNVLGKGGPYGGGNKWAEYTITFEPSKQFLIRLCNFASNWYLVASIDLTLDTTIGALGGTVAGVKTVSLTTLSPEVANVGFGKMLINQAFNNAKVIIDGKVCNEYLFAHANSLLRFKVPKGMSAFSAIGLCSHRNKSVKFKVVGDGVPLFESKELTQYENNQVSIRVKLPDNAKIVELITDDCGNGKADHSVWAYPRFETGSVMK